MIVDYLSDIHIDYYFKDLDSTNDASITSIFEPIFLDNQKRKAGDVLIVAGDIGHDNEQSVKALTIFKKWYKHVICVAGNHDLYLLNSKMKHEYNMDSLQRFRELKQLCLESGIHFLDGDVIELEGVRFGGAMGWYDGAYIYTHFNNYFNVTETRINRVWQTSLNDKKCILPFQNFDDIFKIELPKIERVYKECDVMITHFNPSIKKEHQNQTYKGQESTGFFCWNGEEYLKNGTMKHWVFGHTHSDFEYEQHEVKCMVNAFGYPNESHLGDWVWIKSFEVNCAKTNL